MPEAAEAAAAVDGEDSKAWHLPLSPLNATSLPEPYLPGILFQQGFASLHAGQLCNKITLDEDQACFQSRLAG